MANPFIECVRPCRKFAAQIASKCPASMGNSILSKIIHEFVSPAFQIYSVDEPDFQQMRTNWYKTLKTQPLRAQTSNNIKEEYTDMSRLNRSRLEYLFLSCVLQDLYSSKIFQILLQPAHIIERLPTTHYIITTGYNSIQRIFQYLIQAGLAV